MPSIAFQKHSSVLFCLFILLPLKAFKIKCLICFHNFLLPSPLLLRWIKAAPKPVLWDWYTKNSIKWGGMPKKGESCKKREPPNDTIFQRVHSHPLLRVGKGGRSYLRADLKLINGHVRQKKMKICYKNSYILIAIIKMHSRTLVFCFYCVLLSLYFNTKIYF